MMAEIFFFFNPMCGIKGEGCYKAQSRKVVDFGVTKTMTSLPFINCVSRGKLLNILKAVFFPLL